MRVLFLNPHPDDTEATCANACKYCIDHNWDVHEVLMTSDEYGVADNRFKGLRIRRIRMHEMEQAAKCYGINSDSSLTGLLAYLIIRDLPASKRPILLLYHSLKTNFEIPIKSLDFQIDAWSRHRSQSSPWQNKTFKWGLKFLGLSRLYLSGRISERYRRISFTPEENELHGFGKKFWYYLFAQLFKAQPRSFYTPTPQELGLRSEFD